MTFTLHSILLSKMGALGFLLLTFASYFQYFGITFFL